MASAGIGSDGKQFTMKKFPFGNELTYTLKDGEYFYFTDANKTAMVYYGSGTIIRRSNTSIELVKNNEDIDAAEAADIISSGMISSIPWIGKQFDAQNYLTVEERQFVTLTAGDTITELEADANNVVSTAHYRLAGSTTEKTLPAINIDGAN